MALNGQESRAVVLKCYNHLGRLFKHGLLGLIPKVADSVGLGGARVFARVASFQVLLVLLAWTPF